MTKGRRGMLADTLGRHRLFALAALHAARMRSGGKVPNGVNLGYVLAMGVGIVPLAIILDWFAVLSWSSDFVIIRTLFTIPGLVCTLLGLICWLYLLTYAVIYIGAFIRAWCQARRG